MRKWRPPKMGAPLGKWGPPVHVHVYLSREALSQLNIQFIAGSSNITLIRTSTYTNIIIPIQVASARFARFSYCGRGFPRSAHFTSYGNKECMIEVVKPNMCMVFTCFGYCGLGFAPCCSLRPLHIVCQPSVCPLLK